MLLIKKKTKKTTELFQEITVFALLTVLKNRTEWTFSVLRAPEEGWPPDFIYRRAWKINYNKDFNLSQVAVQPSKHNHTFVLNYALR